MFLLQFLYNLVFFVNEVECLFQSIFVCIVNTIFQRNLKLQSLVSIFMKMKSSF